MKSVYALWLHGIGSQDSKYADYAQKHLSSALSERGHVLYGRAVHYAPLFQGAADKFLRDAQKAGSSGNMTQKLSVNVLSDALQFQANQKLREQICNVIDYEYLQLRCPDEVVVFAHSLGCMAFVEWLRTRKAVKKVKFVTMGCNIGLFTLGMPFDCPDQIKRPGTWLNLFDPSDFLGFAMGVRVETAHVKDIEVQVGGFLGMTGLAHICYLEDNNLWTNTIPKLLVGR